NFDSKRVGAVGRLDARPGLAVGVEGDRRALSRPRTRRGAAPERVILTRGIGHDERDGLAGETAAVVVVADDRQGRVVTDLAGVVTAHADAARGECGGSHDSDGS